eukprot:gnl/TRDRNA2_/TRDRNA2_174984_c2_seq1.p1 gnl/TRDRNA2_/TRDRNA2_174984_c2~~gnl/TRDRNA2_/TRDRNA2_174984_c2_seq1.p1  ORF type:complete len:719 (-),score=103.54 gnl/TRDRNA2_/TRDRNA2_174984_c2_seq1:173-2329(-)
MSLPSTMALLAYRGQSRFRWPSVVFAACVTGCSATIATDPLGMPIFKPNAEPPSFEVWVEVPAEVTTSTPQPSGGALQFPLQSSQVSAKVANGVVYARVTQVYRNDGQDCLQSRYIFPLPTRAAISAMEMHVGNRIVEGQIRKKADAREEFERARDAGQSASLLDQERPNVFAMELANILPGETTRVVVDYVETLVPVDGVYAYTFPSVVGPRYVGSGDQAWAPGRDTSNLKIDVDLEVMPGYLGIESSLNFTELKMENKGMKVSTSGENTDIVLKFWFTKESCGARLLISEWNAEKYYLLGIQPPQRRLLTSEQITKREYLFILDVSGSMTGYPIRLSKDLMKTLLKENVRPDDSLNILLFAGASAVLDGTSWKATPENVDKALQWLDNNMHAGGSTRLLQALNTAFALPQLYEDASRTIVVMTDGYVAVEQEAFDVVRSNLGDANMFVFGIGQSINHYLVEGLARVGQGEPFVVGDGKDGDKVAADLQRYIDSPVLTRLRLSFEGSFTPREQEPPHLPDVFASRPIQVVGKWAGNLSGRVRVGGLLAGGVNWEYSADLAELPVVREPAVPLLWARSRIALLADYAGVADYYEKEEIAENITELGLQYSLMTEYTSFVAVDSDPTSPDVCLAKPDGGKDSSALPPPPPDASADEGQGGSVLSPSPPPIPRAPPPAPPPSPSPTPMMSASADSAEVSGAHGAMSALLVLLSTAGLAWM